MITLQHSLVTLLSELAQTKDNEGKNKVEDAVKKEIPYVLIPDAIRRYMGPRPYSHFEQTPDGSSISWMHFPTNLKTVSKDNIENSVNHFLAEGYRPCVLGEETHIEKFKETNGDLPSDYYYGVLKHLTQDSIFDEWIRKGIGLDCSRRFDSMHSPEETTAKNIGVYKFKRPRKSDTGEIIKDNEGNVVTDEETLDGAQVRNLIAEIENQGVYILAYLLNEKYGITANQEWFDKNVKGPLDEVYSQDLSNGTYNYMKIPEEINERITKGDWTHLNKGIIPYDVYRKMYEDVILSMAEIDIDKKENAEKRKPVEYPDFDE